MKEDIRWHQRFSNYKKALQKLSEAVEYVNENVSDTETLDEILKEGLIQRFEYTHELAWNVMRDYAFYQGNSMVGGSRDATREAFKLQLIEDGDTWMEMIGSRNLTSHTYNEETANDIFQKILAAYFPVFISFKETMEMKLSKDAESL